MKAFTVKRLFIALVLLVGFTSTWAQNPVNWTDKQLMEPADLAKSINDNKGVPVVISIGPGATIPQSIAIGSVNEQAGVDKLKAALQKVSRQSKVVVYCGCCPFEHCPNARPAVSALKEMKFTNYYLLNLPHNIKTDWIDKGFPVAKQ
jgi:hypothetical protein